MAWWTQPFVMLYIFVFGAAVGSFLNVVIYRLPREKSLVRPRSACPACGALIRWFDNIPVLSWLALRGRCRSCDAPISVRYPLVEVAAGAFAVLALWRWGISLVAAEVVVFAWISLVLGLIDLDFENFERPDPTLSDLSTLRAKRLAIVSPGPSTESSITALFLRQDLANNGVSAGTMVCEAAGNPLADY